MTTTTTFSFYYAIKEWAKIKWPQLYVGPELQTSTAEPWVQITVFDKDWTVVDLFPNLFYYRVRTITKWTSTKLVADPNVDEIWGEEHLNIADPLYFEKLAPFVESSLIHTLESIKSRGGP